MDRAQKASSIEELKGVFASSGAVVVTHYLGLTVAEMSELRGRLRKEGARLKVVKNRLAQKAMDGSAGAAGEALFKGPVAIAFAKDPVSAAKVTTQYAKDNDKFTVVGAVLGSSVLNQDGVKSLATLAVLGPAPRPAHRAHPGARDQDRRRPGRARGPARPRPSTPMRPRTRQAQRRGGLSHRSFPHI